VPREAATRATLARATPARTDATMYMVDDRAPGRGVPPCGRVP